jgi:hypothetical protein
VLLKTIVLNLFFRLINTSQISSSNAQCKSQVHALLLRKLFKFPTSGAHVGNLGLKKCVEHSSKAVRNASVISRLLKHYPELISEVAQKVYVTTQPLWRHCIYVTTDEHFIQEKEIRRPTVWRLCRANGRICATRTW